MNSLFLKRSFFVSFLLPILLLTLLLVRSAPASSVSAAGCAIGEGHWGGGPPKDAEQWSSGADDLLIVGSGAELIVFDIEVPAAPVELGRVLVGHEAHSVAISADGQLASVSDWFDNVSLVDISDRDAPVVRGRFAWAGIQQPTGMVFDGGYLYVAVRTVGLTVLDISDPDSPQFVANSAGSVSDFVFDVALRGDHAYLGQGADGVQIVDVSNPGSPSVVGSHAASIGAGQIDIVGDRAYVAMGGNGFAILDLANPVAPGEVGSFDTSDFVYETALLQGDRLALANGYSGTLVIDISTPSTPLQVGSFGGTSSRLTALDDRVFITPAEGSRIRLVDFQTPASPAELGYIDFAGISQAVSVGAEHVLVANGDGGLVMLASSNPVQPTYVGRIDGDVRRVGHVNGYGVASASYDGDIRVIDTLLTGPVQVATIANGFQTNDLIGEGNRLYVASGEFGGLRIHDMSNPLVPQLLGSFVPAGEVVWQIAVSGNFLYSGYVNDPDLLVIDIFDPATPTTVGSGFVLPGGATDIAVSGNAVFVGTELFGVRILQNDGAGNLAEIADIDISPASVAGVSVDGTQLHISAGVFSGLLVYDISNPANPQFVEQHNTAGEGRAVHASNGVIAMAEGSSGASTFGCAVVATNQPPVTVGVIGDQTGVTGQTIFPLSVNPNFDDPDGQALQYAATGLPSGLSIGTGSGVIQGTLDAMSVGSHPVQVTATDPFDLFVSQAFTWTVMGEQVFNNGFE